MRRSLLIAPFVIAACGPAEQPAKVPVQPPPVERPTEAPKAPPLARWSFPDSGFESSGRPLDLGDGRVLYAGHQGRRALKGKDSFQEATTLLPENVESMARDAKGHIAFLGSTGTTWIAHEPLGPIVEVRTSPKPFVHASAGKSAMVGIDANGALFRSTDQGASWTPITSPYKGPGRIFDVALDATGRGLAIAAPQRAFVTSDDGATWSPVATPGLGMMYLEHDAAGSVLLQGNKLIGLEGTTLKGDVTSQSLSDVPKPVLQPVLSVGFMGIAGQHLWAQGADDANASRLLVASVGGAFGAPIPGPDDCDPTRPFAAADSELHMACTGNDDTRLLKLTGKTWNIEATVPGQLSNWITPAMGSGGYVLFPSVCKGSEECGAFARLAGSKAFEKLELDGEVLASAVDGKGRVFVVARKKDRTVLFEGTTTSKTLRRSPLLDIEPTDRAQVFAADDGTLQVVTDHWEYWAIRTFKDGKPLGTRYLADVTSVAFAGPHALAIGREGVAWESADAGVTWSRVGAPSYGELSCNLEGCVVGSAVRVGWDLPGLAGMPTITARDTPPDPKHDEKWVKPWASDATCAMVGPWSSLSSAPPLARDMDYSPAVQWVSLDRGSDARIQVSVAKAGKVQKLELLAAEKADKTHRVRTLVDGYAAARVSYETKKEAGKLNPVDLEIGWLAPRSGKVGKVKLPKAATFRVSSFGNGGIALTALDDDLILRIPTGQRWLLHPNGKHEALPDSASVARRAVTVGKHVVTLDGDASRTRLTWDGKDTRTWRLVPPGVTSGDWEFTRGASPMLAGWVRTGARRELWAFPLGEPSNDPPEPWVIDVDALRAKGILAAACDPKGLEAPGAIIQLATGRMRVAITGAGNASVFTDAMSVHLTGNGSACVGAWYGSNGELRMILPTRDPKHAVLFSNELWSTRTLECK